MVNNWSITSFAHYMNSLFKAVFCSRKPHFFRNCRATGSLENGSVRLLRIQWPVTWGSVLSGLYF